MRNRRKILPVIGALLLVIPAGVGIWMLVNRYVAGTSENVELTLGKTEYAVGEPVTAVVRNTAKATVRFSENFSVIRQEEEVQRVVFYVSDTCECGKACTTGSPKTLVFGEGANLTWDGKLHQCKDGVKIPPQDPEPGEYRFQIELLGENWQGGSAEDTSPIVSPIFTIVAAENPEAPTNTNEAAPVSGDGNGEEAVSGCQTDADCQVAGCSNELCVGKDESPLSTCEIKKEYACLKETSCGCVAGECAWKETEAYRACLTNVGSP